MKPRILFLLPALITVSLAGLLFLSGCELLFPPAFYSDLVSKDSKSSSSSSSSGPKSWVTIGSTGFSTISPSGTPSIKVDSSGRPMVAYCYGLYTYLNLFDGTSWNEISYSCSTMAGIAFTLSNGTLPYIFINESSPEIIYYETTFTSLTPAFSYTGGSAVSIAFSNNMLCVGEFYSTAYQGFVFNGSVWSIAGTLGAPIIDNSELLFHNSYFYLSYHKQSGGICIRRFSAMDDMGTSTEYPLDGTASSFDMTTSGGAAYIVCINGSDNTELDIFRYDGTVTPIGAITGQGFMKNYPSIAANGPNDIYVAFAEDSMMYLRVFHYDGISWTPTAGDLGRAQATSMEMASDGTLYLCYKDSDATLSGAITVKAYK